MMYLTEMFSLAYKNTVIEEGSRMTYVMYTIVNQSQIFTPGST